MPAIIPYNLSNAWFGDTVGRTNPIEIDLTNLTIVGGGSVYGFDTVDPTDVIVTDNRDHIIHNVGVLSNTGVHVIIFEYSLINVGSDGLSADTGTDTNGINSYNNIKNTLPLFRDPENDDYRLWHKGVQDSSGNYYTINSPAVKADSDGKDMGAWDYSYACLAETSDVFYLGNGGSSDQDCSDGYETFTATNERVNYQTFYDVKGGFHHTYDGNCLRIEMTYPDRYFKGSDYSFDFQNLIRSEIIDLKRYYPNGDDGIISGLIEHFSGNTYNFDPALVRGMRVNFYKGWILKLDWIVGIDTGTAYYTITANTANTVTIEFLRGDLPTSITVDAGSVGTILYLPVLLDMPESAMVSLDYTESHKEIGVVSTSRKPWYKQIDDPESDEFHINTITLKQTIERATGC